MPERRLPKWIPFALAGAVAVMLLAAVALWNLNSQPNLPVLGAAPAFSLIDQQGRKVSSDELRGKVLLVGFIYTSCTDICPMLTQQMRTLQTRLKEAGLLGTDATLLSVTVDPERDTPEVLAKYAAQHQADTATWRFLTGDPEQVREVVVKGFMLPMEKNGHDHGAGAQSYEVGHSGRIALVDKAGRIRTYYDGEALDFARVLADVKALR